MLGLLHKGPMCLLHLLPVQLLLPCCLPPPFLSPSTGGWECRALVGPQEKTWQGLEKNLDIGMK